ncbi:DUF924 family protein [Lysobacter sp. A03]|uniref:DUF924 family protein n=1 Tax=Lysobacter sp. A03 TaxID=1199154 RepID=UPI0005B7188A|nr:DUF924 family protein [Lysobacter sp. A03]KIQ96926.1 putative transmembrane protein [Lysobacter sp. A03]
METTAEAVLEFWREAGPDMWFGGGEAFDRRVREHLLDAHMAASRGELQEWMESAESAMALVLLLDQIPRHIFRASAHAYATDPLACEVATRAVGHGFDTQIDPELRRFFYLPFTHSEDPMQQQRSVELHRTMPGEEPDKWALHHQAIIERFGRFPHRNALFGRATTPTEQAWLDEGGFNG